MMPILPIFQSSILPTPVFHNLPTFRYTLPTTMTDSQDTRQQKESAIGKRLFFLAARIMHRLPRGWALALGRGLGRLAPLLAARHFKRVIRDITLAYGDEKTPQEIEQIARQFYQQMGVNVAEFLRMPYLTAEEVHRYATIEGVEYLDAALARGKGVIFCVAHIGNWEMLATVMGRSGYDITAIVRPQADSAMTELFNRIRRAHGLNVVNMDEIMAIIRLLKRNGGIGVMGDLNSKNPGAFVQFFGRPSASFTGAAYLARLTGAAVISIFEERLPDNRHVVRIGPPIPFVRTEDAGRDTLINTMRFTNVVEQEIRRRPQDWFWLANRWKTRPEDIENPERIPMEHRDLTPEETREALAAVTDYHSYRRSS